MVRTCNSKNSCYTAWCTVAAHVNIHIQANYVLLPKSHLMPMVRHTCSNPFIYSMLRRAFGLWCEVLIEVFPVISVLLGFCGYCCSGDQQHMYRCWRVFFGRGGSGPSFIIVSITLIGKERQYSYSGTSSEAMLSCRKCNLDRHACKSFA
jgi:hypothetical protein